ncbi:thioredoxin-like protein [Bimuria novae-zelandiae CBS 107.79]|uniref:Thioredoxin-like protein n=1 Tax=Bimuria novae-zelandiae CBS 107.79 TaxID=1447943 RepID=A0A6A5V3E1_9PLEO|nr:thioredoxin-like protein [Bimuria novae-zelandiae CBS 107.79]
MSTIGNPIFKSLTPGTPLSTVTEVSLSTYINEIKKSWRIILFIPAAFSFVCPTEFLAFQNCLEEFKDRICDVVFVSVDTKHSLWHWMNLPRQYGGLGQIDIALLSDVSHKMCRDYGVLVEDEGISLRGVFILDEEAVVQQITLNNLTVGRSVLEALRLPKVFQAVAKHGVLCPIDWKPSTNAADTLSTAL